MDGPASILQCSPCTLLVRAEEQNGATERYANDQYDAGVMEQLFPRYVEAFRRKETPYRILLREGAEVLEIGSHFGAFLKVAAEWGLETGRHRRRPGHSEFCPLEGTGNIPRHAPRLQVSERAFRRGLRLELF